MSKYINETHIVGERGANVFADYCNRHKPYLIWRETTKNDFGIDGEVEITGQNSEGKRIAVGEIIKIQIKSTSKGSYIHNESDKSFDFLAKDNDIDYWTSFNLSVVLIIYDDRSSKLYAKKIDESDLILSRKHQKITFDKKTNALKVGKDNFLEKFSNSLKKRINYEVKEKIESNLFQLKVPHFIFHYKTNLKSKKEIFQRVGYQECPLFVLRSDNIYTLGTIKYYPRFKEIIEESDENQKYFKDFIIDAENRNCVSELIYLHIKDYLYSKGISYNRKYNRYYFRMGEPEEDRKEEYISKTGKTISRTVVSFKKYKVLQFYRHLAFSIKVLYLEDGMFVIIDPQNLYTSDGKIPLTDKKLITGLTNYIKQKEFNPQVLNHLYFFFSYLSSKKPYVSIFDRNGMIISLKSPKYFEVNYGIPLDFVEYQDEENPQPTFDFGDDIK